MANELKIVVAMNYSKNGINLNYAKSMGIDISGDSITWAEEQTVGTSEEALTFSEDISTLGRVLLVNLDSANYVEYGISTGVYHIKSLAGEFESFRPNANTLYAKANTDAVKILKLILAN